MEDAALVDFYLRLHTNRFVSALEMGDAACNLSTVAYLHFEASLSPGFSWRLFPIHVCVLTAHKQYGLHQSC